MAAEKLSVVGKTSPYKEPPFRRSKILLGLMQIYELYILMGILIHF
jgi:hypothetical protein